ncbi:MAG: sigma factor-like helix-turn-helix DNA-binding protein [Polyangiales bacterium]
MVLEDRQWESLRAEAESVYPSVRFDGARHVIEEQLASGVALEELHAVDLLLARRGAQGDRAAVACIERTFIARIAAWLGAIETDALVIDEVKQRVRVLTLSGSPPKINEYRGRGPLGAWLRVVSLREHAEHYRARGVVARGAVSDEQLAELAQSEGLSPELACVKARYRPVMSAAFRAAIQGLSARERTLLKLCYVDGLSLDAIGGLYAVNKSTVSRWMASIREQVLDRAIDHARREIDGASDDVEALLSAVRSGVDWSLRGLL